MTITKEKLESPQPERIPEHPKSLFLRMDRMPHIWCSRCGIGIALGCFAAAMEKAGLGPDDITVTSGIGCTGRVAGYAKVDSFHTTHGRAIPFAVGLTMARPDMKHVIFSGDGDLISIGGNHFIHAARRNQNLLIICVNNFIYAMTGGQLAPTTPISARTTTAPYGSFERPFNLPYLAASAGACYVARWTSLHIRRLTDSMTEALNRTGFRFIEVIAPCSTIYARRNKLGTGLDLMKYYYESSVTEFDAPLRSLDIEFQSKIIVGKFLDEQRPTFVGGMKSHLKNVLGDKFVPPVPGGQK
ncbi:MAG TPA: 2-oxoacid:ferredoxin oxidoreductase subunit beta [Firmicutes bacterium]|nr:2-oxoacid:ferredoxin oxidoreductase subunit beta [Bacillota bacterium]